MPLTPLPNTVPPDPTTRAWRYLDFKKFGDLLARRALFFPKVATLRQNEPLEGSVPRSEVEFRRREALLRFANPAIGTPQFERMMVNERGTQEYHEVIYPQMTVVSCWHLREHESKSMWDRYAGKEDRSIAIRSTVGGLQRALAHFEGDMNFARVGYIDFEKQAWMDGGHYTVPSYNFMVPIITKSIEYQDEQELRLTYRHDGWDHASFWAKQELDSGLFIPVDLHELVHAVILAPGTNEAHAEEIRVLIRQAGLSPRVFRSSLDRTPVY